MADARVVGKLAAAFRAEDWGTIRQLATQLEGAGTGGDFESVGADELYAPLETPTYTIDRIARKGSLALLGAYGSSAKTWMMTDAVVAVGAGLPWLFRYGCRQGPAGIIDYEQGLYETKRRVQALTGGRGLDRVAGLKAVCMPKDIYLGQPKFVAALERFADGKELIGFDSLRAGSLGDENDSTIRKGLDDCHGVAERTGCTMLVLVHAKKKGADGVGDNREVFRGSSAIFDAADSALVVERLEEGFKLTQVKSRSGQGVEPFMVRLEDCQGGLKVIGSDVEKEPIEETSDAAFEGICERVRLLIVTTPSISREEIRAAVQARNEVVTAALARLERTGVIDSQKLPSRRVMYFANPPKT